MPNKIVTINGKLYDAVTGLPVVGASKKAAASVGMAAKKVVQATRLSGTPAANVHQKTQRTETLRSRVSMKPAPHKLITHGAPGRLMDVARHEAVNRFAPHPHQKVTSAAQKTTPDTPPQKHPLVQRASNRLPKRNASVPAKVAAPSAKQIKETAIAKALATPSTQSSKKRARVPRHIRISAIVVASLAILVIAGWLTYTNIPSVSVNVAAAQAGIDAKYPQYHPDGYSLVQPVTYSDGKVVLSFTSNSGTSSFKITQARSSWDSSAVLQSIVHPAAGDNFITSEEQGLTVYIYDTNAAWVNGGILYTITGNAPLSGQQIRQIATSM